MEERRGWCRVTIVGPDGELLVSAALSGPGAPDVLAVDTVGRLALVAKRVGATIRVVDVAPGLGELLELAALGVEVEREAEAREEAFGVEHGEEEAHGPDPPL